MELVRRASIFTLPGCYFIERGCVGVYQINEKIHSRRFFYSVGNMGEYVYATSNSFHFAFVDSVVIKPDLISIAHMMNATDRLIFLRSIENLKVMDRLKYLLRLLSKNSEITLTHPDGLLVMISRTDLADVLNVTREAVTRALNDLHDNGALQIESRKRGILLTNNAKDGVLNGLKQIQNGC